MSMILYTRGILIVPTDQKVPRSTARTSSTYVKRHPQQEIRSGTGTSMDTGVSRWSTCRCRSASTGAGKWGKWWE